MCDDEWNSEPRCVPCWTYGPGDQLLPIPACPYTDGRLGTEPIHLLWDKRLRNACLWEHDSSHPRTVLLDLGSVQLLDAVIWRGCPNCHVELSLDGNVWLD